MNETDARDALLVRAYETAPGVREDLWSAGDRQWASRAALAIEGEQSDSDRFVARRAQLAADRITQRDHSAANARRILRWRPWIARSIAGLAFIAGVASDAIGGSQRISLLAAPMLGLVLWNLAIYLLMFGRYISAPWRAGAPARWSLTMPVTWLTQGFGSIRRAMRMPEPLPAFAAAWVRASQALTAARIAALLHASAALFGAGMLCAMYLRGLVLEYRAGWESTFLNAEMMHFLLKIVLGPAAALTGIALPGPEAVQALRMPTNPGAPAASWIHLYAVTVTITVLLPRLVLALWQGWLAKRLARRFALPLDDRYFRGLERSGRDRTATVQVLVCGARAVPETRAALAALFGAVLGPGTKLEIFVQLTLDEPPRFAHDTDTLPDMLVLLIPLGASPEFEIHGEFIEALAAQVPAAVPFVVLIDESAFRDRFENTGLSGLARIEERRAAWRQMLAQIDHVPVFADLANQDFEQGRSSLPDALRRLIWTSRT